MEKHCIVVAICYLLYFEGLDTADGQNPALPIKRNIP